MARRLSVVARYVVAFSCLCNLSLSGLAAEPKARESRFGVCAHFMWMKDERDRLDLCLDAMKECGIGYFRTETSWVAAQPEKGAPFNFDSWDEVLDGAKRRGLRVDALLTGGVPPFARHIADNLGAASEFARAVVSHSGLKNWEVMNEPNLSHYWYREPSPKEYAGLLKAFYSAVKKADPNATVMFAGVAGVPLEFIEAVFKEGGTEHFDEMNIHPYQWYGIPEYPLIRDIGALKELMKKYGVGDKPISITEMGHSTGKLKTPQIFASALRSLGLDPRRIEYAVIEDARANSNSLGLFERIGALIDGARIQKKISFSEIGKLNPKNNPVLVMPFDESFPHSEIPALTDYINAGGTVLFPGGYPLWYDIVFDADGHSRKVARMDAGCKALGIPPQKIVAPIKGSVHFTYFDSVEPAEGFAEIKPEGEFVARCLPDPEAGSGYSIVPILLGVWKDERGETQKSPAAAIYKKRGGGNIICCTSFIDEVVPQDMQANYTVREMLLCYALGIKKIAVYCLRDSGYGISREENFGIVGKNMEKKPLFYAYKTLTEKLGELSKPAYMEKDGLFVVNWVRPEDGGKVWAFWSARGIKAFDFNSPEKYVFFDVCGKEIAAPVAESGKMKAGPSPVYAELKKSTALTEK